MTDIKGYDGLYAITTCGKVWSYKSKKFLKLRTTKNGYKQVALCKNGKYKYKYIHRLIAEAYIPNPDNLPEVNHMDENKEHNYTNNLEWCSKEYNNNYSTRTERAGKAHRKPIYCVELDKVYECQSIACKELNINAGQLSGVLNGTTRHKTAGGYHWQYKR